MLAFMALLASFLPVLTQSKLSANHNETFSADAGEPPARSESRA